MRYSLDTSALLNGWVRHYPPDVFPRLWKEIEDLIADREVRATDEVKLELEKKHDAVLAWANQRAGDLFVPFDEGVQEIVRDLLQRHPKIIDTRAGRSGADPFVIALAIKEGCAVVTGESPTGSAKRPHIPDVCNAMGVRWISLLELIREQRWTF
jgi:hypothetical protein